MFKEARLKLSVWYLLIIMIISLSFSALVYKIISNEIDNRFMAIEHRMHLRALGFNPPPGQVRIFFDDSEEIKGRVFLYLVYINSVILIFSGGAGYFLAGKTLQPIEISIEEQKRFISDASHELRTPLTSLQASHEVALRDKSLNIKSAKKYLKENLEDVKKLNKLTHYLLDISRVSEKSKPHKQIVYLSEVVLEVVKSFEKHREINTQLKPVRVFIDREEVKQLISILIDNAIKYSSKKVDIKLVSEKSLAVLSVRDKGIGISKSDLSKIFDRFYRVDKSRNKVVEGFGLGLSLARKLAESNDIKISVNSELNKGTVFKLLLKLA